MYYICLQIKPSETVHLFMRDIRMHAHEVKLKSLVLSILTNKKKILFYTSCENFIKPFCDYSDRAKFDYITFIEIPRNPAIFESSSELSNF